MQSNGDKTSFVVKKTNLVVVRLDPYIAMMGFLLVYNILLSLLKW